MSLICYVSKDDGEYSEYAFSEDVRLYDIANDIKAPGAICALMDGSIVSLADAPAGDAKIQFLSPEKSQHASRVFLRGATFLLYCAAKALFPDRTLKVDHALYGCVFCRLGDISDDDVKSLQDRIYGYISEDRDFMLEMMSINEAKKIMIEQGLIKKVALLSYRPFDYYRLYEFEGFKNYFHGIMPKSSGCLSDVHLFPYANGFMLKYPTPYTEGGRSIIDQPKYAKVFAQAEKWAEVLSATYVSDINDMLRRGGIADFIEVNEALHERTIASIAQRIVEREDVRIVLIAGPSSSGKTTFAHRLAVHLRAIGKKCRPVSIDDYYKNREDIPFDEKGRPDFECLLSIDLSKLNDDLNKLLNGETAELPKYDFTSGKRKECSVPLNIDDDLLIIEGIHGMNDSLTEHIPADMKFKIFVSPLSTLNLDYQNVVFPDDLRLIRRLVRDKRSRGFSFEQTLSIWDSVRRGEFKYILPYQETADVMFNSTLLYEPLVLKKHCYTDLKRFTPGMKNYPEALSLLKFMNYFLNLDDESAIPAGSILREFIGPIKI